jgi:hypothetical protein
MFHPTSSNNVLRPNRIISRRQNRYLKASHTRDVVVKLRLFSENTQQNRAGPPNQIFDFPINGPLEQKIGKVGNRRALVRAVAQRMVDGITS